MQYGQFAVDYEERGYNPDRMRKARVAKAQASLKKQGLGALVLFDYDHHRYLSYYSFHQYARRRLGHETGAWRWLLRARGAGTPPSRSVRVRASTGQNLSSNGAIWLILWPKT